MATYPFPFIVTKRDVIAKTIVNRIPHDTLSGKGFSATAKYIQEAYMNTYVGLLSDYVSPARRG